MVCVRYWAGARDVAGTGEEIVAAAPLPRLLADLGERYGERMTKLLRVSVLLLDGKQVDADDAITPGADGVVEILPPYAGG